MLRLAGALYFPFYGGGGLLIKKISVSNGKLARYAPVALIPAFRSVNSARRTYSAVYMIEIARRGSVPDFYTYLPI